MKSPTATEPNLRRISVSAVKTRLFRARQILRAKLAHLRADGASTSHFPAHPLTAPKTKRRKHQKSFPKPNDRIERMKQRQRKSSQTKK